MYRATGVVLIICIGVAAWMTYKTHLAKALDPRRDIFGRQRHRDKRRLQHIELQALGLQWHDACVRHLIRPSAVNALQVQLARQRIIAMREANDRGERVITLVAPPSD